MQIKHYLGSVIKDLPTGIEKAADGLWGIATRECADKEGDIIRMEGLSLEYHTAASPIKILAQHKTALPDGRVPVIGRVEEFRKTKVGGADTLLFRMSWAKNGEGELLPLAKEYKDYYDGGYMTDFSVGCQVHDAEPIKDGGYDYKKTALFEISGVTIGAHQNAAKVASRDEDQLNKLTQAIDRLRERFDVFESNSVTRSDAAEQTGDRQDQQDDDFLARLAERIRSSL
jgi:hypothetical protein